MKTKHIAHATVKSSGKNIRVEAETFEGMIDALNKATNNAPIENLEHIAGLGE